MSESRTNAAAPEQIDLAAREQALLDTALLESDQLLARSLHEDDRRRRLRRNWSLALILGGVVMGTILLAFLLGWFTLGQVQSRVEAFPAQVERARAEALSGEGWKFWKAGEYLGAVAQFEEVVKLTPKDANAWNGLGWALFNSGQRTRATEAFQKCVALDMNHPAGLNGLGQVYLAEGEMSLAKKYLRQAAPKAPAAWYGLTCIYLLEGDFKEAKKWAEKLVAQGSADETATQMLVAAVAEKLDDDLRQRIEPAKSAKEEDSPQKKSGDAVSSTLEADERTEPWRERLLSTKESDRWFVGANIGQELLQIEDDFPFELLQATWDEIPTSVRKQVLKGFTPGMMGNEKLHPRFFDVMDLGMQDETEVREYAATYIKMQGLPNFLHEKEKYLAWREATRELDAKAIVAEAKSGRSRSTD